MLFFKESHHNVLKVGIQCTQCLDMLERAGFKLYNLGNTSVARHPERRVKRGCERRSCPYTNTDIICIYFPRYIKGLMI